VAEPLTERTEVVARLLDVSDIAVTHTQIEALRTRRGRGIGHRRRL